jgi:hypothetical protein
MKRLTPAFLALLLLLAAGCNSNSVNRHFYLNYSTKAAFPANVPANVYITITSPLIATNSGQAFQQNNTAANLIQSIQLNGLTLIINSPEGQTFSFLQNAIAYISTDSLPEIEIANKQNIPANVGDTLAFDVNPLDLQKYIKANQIKFRVSGTTGQPVNDEIINVTLNVQFFAQADLVAIL